MSLEIIANAWTVLKEAVKRLLDYYWYYSESEYMFLDPNSEEIIIYQYLLEEWEVG